MSTVNARIAKAFWDGTPTIVQNTIVSVDGNVVTVRLHGHPIARREHNRLEVSAAGCETQTTKSRINEILRRKGYSINQRRHMWFIKVHPSLSSHEIRMDTESGIWTLVDPGSELEQILHGSEFDLEKHNENQNQL